LNNTGAQNLVEQARLRMINNAGDSDKPEDKGIGRE
jgi:hypothetical protein